MAEELQHLIERIRKEGVESGEKAADSLVAEAKKKAAAIVAEAQKQAQAEIAKADADAVAFAERGKKTLEQAARDLLISIGGAVGDVVAGTVDAKVGAALTPDLMAQMLLKTRGGLFRFFAALTGIEVGSFFDGGSWNSGWNGNCQCGA